MSEKTDFKKNEIDLMMERTGGKRCLNVLLERM